MSILEMDFERTFFRSSSHSIMLWLLNLATGEVVTVDLILSLLEYQVVD